LYQKVRTSASEEPPLPLCSQTVRGRLLWTAPNGIVRR